MILFVILFPTTVSCVKYIQAISPRYSTNPAQISFHVGVLCLPPKFTWKKTNPHHIFICDASNTILRILIFQEGAYIYGCRAVFESNGSCAFWSQCLAFIRPAEKIYPAIWILNVADTLFISSVMGYHHVCKRIGLIPRISCCTRDWTYQQLLGILSLNGQCV